MTMSPVPMAVVPLPSRQETVGSMEYQTGNNRRASRTLDPMPYTAVNGHSSRQGSRRLSMGPMTALNPAQGMTMETGGGMDQAGMTMTRPVTALRDDTDATLDWIVPVDDKVRYRFSYSMGEAGHDILFSR